MMKNNVDVSEITKEDSVTGNQAQGEGTLKGAVYGLYAREDIVDPADQSVIYKAGKKVKELTIDENGHATTKDDLHLGALFSQRNQSIKWIYT